MNGWIGLQKVINFKFFFFEINLRFVILKAPTLHNNIEMTQQIANKNKPD